jgi:DNA topoisomerase I
MQVVVVESPAKAKTINKYLGSDYHVLASYGHVRDLPAKDGSVDPDNDFAMLWDVDSDRAKQLKAIADEVKKADRLILATDPDREGEAISWHLLEVLRQKKALPREGVARVTFNEITKSAVMQAMARPRMLDQELIDAYLARRALDYLVGFTLSPVLWRKLPGARSAGRVQSVALRLICARELEIERFVARTYFTITAQLATPKSEAFKARLTHLEGQKLDKFDLNTQEQADAARLLVANSAYRISAVEQKPVLRNPPAPFTTSTLQQEAARKLGFSATQTMKVAQALYEGVSLGGETTGLITYMRTDGVQISQEAVTQTRQVINALYGQDYVPEKPRVYATKAKNAQEAHEGIRPTVLARLPKDVAPYLNDDQRRLYELVWKRTMASQMASARLERTTADLQALDAKSQLRATGQVLLFPGFLALYEEGHDDTEGDDEDKRLPALSVGEAPTVRQVDADQHTTEPPPRFSEASLVKRMEELGIGRPSTYASILQTLRDRDYVQMERQRFIPKDKGRLLTAFLEKFFNRYVEYDFTAGLEEQLDDVSAGKRDWRDVLRAFWLDFKPKTAEVLERKTSDVISAVDGYLAPYLYPVLAQGGDPRQCPSCSNGHLSLKAGKFGAFIGCSNYPECRYTRQFGASDASAAQAEEPQSLGKDPVSGEVISLRMGRFGAYVQRGDGDKPPRASLPKDVPQETLTLDKALALLALPRTVGQHPETGKAILANIGRYGPYLQHDGKYGKLRSTDEVLTIGMNHAVAILAGERSRTSGKEGGGARSAPAAIQDLGESPVTGKSIRVLAGRYGPYVTDGATNATLPKTLSPEQVTREEALALLEEKAAKAPSSAKKSKAAPKKSAPKKNTPPKNTPAPQAKTPTSKAKKAPARAKS